MSCGFFYHRLKNLALHEYWFALLASTVNHPLLSEHQFLCRHLKAKVYSIDYNSISCLYYLLEVVYAFNSVNFSNKLNINTISLT
jgi:hypothetical protein